MRKIACIIAVAIIMIISLIGAIISSSPSYADETVYTELRYQVNASEDDAGSRQCYYGGELVTVDYPTIPVGQKSNWCGDFWGYGTGGMIFPSVDVPDSSGATILNAYIGVYITGVDGGVFVDIYGEDDAFVQNYVANPTINGRNRTVAYSHHENTEIGSGWWYFDVTPVVRELISSPNWSQGNDMGFIWNYNSSFANYVFSYYDYNGSTEYAPKLVMNYAPTWENHYVITYNGLTDAVVGATTVSYPMSCVDYHAINANESGIYLSSAVLYDWGVLTLYTANSYSGDEYYIARSVTRFNTSIIPDDAYITGGTISLTGRATYGENTSLVITGYTNDELWPVDELVHGGNYPFFNREYFVGEYASFYTGEYRFEPEEWVYGTEPLGDGIDSYVNKTGYTNFGLRDINDINDVCPDDVTQIYLYGFMPHLNTSYEHLMPSFITLDTGERPIIENDSVSAMLTIQAILLVLGGIIGIIALLFRGDSISIAARLGLLIALGIMTIIGVAILESIIVSVT